MRSNLAALQGHGLVRSSCHRRAASDVLVVSYCRMSRSRKVKGMPARESLPL